jgi:hypothetical protein
MSIEKTTTRETSRYLSGEVCQGQSGQPSGSAYRSGGVGGDGMSERATAITRETCAREARASTCGTTPKMGKAATARAGVGALHNSEEIPENGTSEGGAVVLMRSNQTENRVMARKG